jgi:hypothetical protein
VTRIISLLQSKVVRFGITIALIWLVGNQPFWRHVFVALSAMLFATLLLPTEMMFFVHHPVLTFAVPFAAGFVGAHLGQSAIRTLAAGAVVAVLAVAIYRAVLESW